MILSETDTMVDSEPHVRLVALGSSNELFLEARKAR